MAEATSDASKHADKIAKKKDMTFVNEPISGTDQQRIDYSALRNPQGGRRIRDLPRWTVDRERDAFFLRLGGGMSREDYLVPFYFLFSWRGIRMRVDAFQKRVSSAADPMLGIVTWEVIRIHLPESLSGSLEILTQLLIQAFDVYGSDSYDTSRTNLSEVRVDFSKQQIVKLTGA